MSRTRAFFLEEATQCLRVARTAIEGDAPDRGTAHRAVRRLRGSAQVARLPDIARRAASLEARLRGADREGGGEWSDTRAAAQDGLQSLEAALEAVRSGDAETSNEGKQRMDGEVRADGVVGMDELEYRGRAALERALELRAAIEDEAAGGQAASMAPLLDELFDLIRLGMK